MDTDLTQQDLIGPFRLSLLLGLLLLFGILVSFCFFVLFETFRRRPPKIRPIPPESTIHRLPPELILLIAGHLPLESIASLRISCYYLYQCLGMLRSASLEGVDYSVIDRFLQLLERDLSTHIACPYCHKLHPISFAKHHRAPERYSLVTQPWPVCWIADRENSLSTNIHPEFSSTIFRMAMKTHRQGHEISKLLSLLSFGPTNTDYWGFVEQRTAAARIEDGSLLVREQRVFMVPTSQKLPLPGYATVDICAHIKFVTMTRMYEYGIQIPYADEVEGYENRQGILCCDYCHTEFRVDFKSYGKASNAIFITKWMDIGEGRDPMDEKFRNRFGSPKMETWTNVRFQRGSICAAFEQKPASEFSFSSLLTQQSKTKLCTGQYFEWPPYINVSLRNVRRKLVIRCGRFRLAETQWLDRRGFDAES